MDVCDLIDQLEEHGIALRAAADEAGLGTAVPTCPGWEIVDLLAHVGMVHRWAAGIVRRDPDAASQSDFPAPRQGVLEWFADGHAALLAALRSAPPDLDAWTFLPAASPLAFWARRQAHETAIHRADAESARGTGPEFSGDFAVDGISELLEGFVSRRRGRLVAEPGFVLGVVPDDQEVSWSVQVTAEARHVIRHGSGQAPSAADCTLRGTAADLYLDLWNRPRPDAVHVEGDERPMRLWRELATISWS